MGARGRAGGTRHGQGAKTSWMGARGRLDAVGGGHVEKGLMPWVVGTRSDAMDEHKGSLMPWARGTRGRADAMGDGHREKVSRPG